MSGFWPAEDASVAAVLDGLHGRARREVPGLHLHYLPKLPCILLGRRLDWTRGLGFYDDKLIAFDRAQGELLHALACAGRATTVVELGTGFGVGALYLAAAMRRTGGRYIGTEIVPGGQQPSSCFGSVQDYLALDWTDRPHRRSPQEFYRTASAACCILTPIASASHSH